jgi:hypothetical protein
MYSSLCILLDISIINTETVVSLSISIIFIVFTESDILIDDVAAHNR